MTSIDNQLQQYQILGKQDTRSGFGDGLFELGQTNENVVALCADLTGSLKMNKFENNFNLIFHSI